MKGGRLLDGKVSLITGTSKGIGKAIAERYAEEGAVVYANARENGVLDQWAEELSLKYSTRVHPVYFDITDLASSRECFVQIKKNESKLDILVNNAGLVSYELLSFVSLDKLREMFEVNVFSLVHFMQLASRIMSRQKQGSIINMASIVAVNGVSGQAGYSASKGAVISLTKSAAKELAPSNIRVNAVAPGMIGTDRLVANYETLFKDKLKFVGMNRLGPPSEVADACVFLGSDMSAYITGQIIGIDGSTSF